MELQQNILDEANKCIADYGILVLSKKSKLNYLTVRKAIDNKACTAFVLKKLVSGINKCKKRTETILSDLN